MKYFFSISSILMGLSLTLSGCDRHDTQVKNEHADSHHMVQEFTSFFEGDRDHIPLSHEFQIVNNVGRHLRFDKIHKSCSCTNADLQASELSVGQKTILRIQVDTARKWGPQSFSARLIDDHGDDWLFELKGMIYRPVNFKEIINMGEISRNKNHSYISTLYVFNLPGSQQVKLKSVKSNNENLIIKLGAGTKEYSTQNIEKTTYPLEIEVKKQETAGNGVTEIVAEYRYGDEMRQSRQKVTWKVRGVFETVPQRVFFRVEEGEDERSNNLILTIRNLDKNDFFIKSIELEDDYIICSYNHSKHGQEHTIEVSRNNKAKLLKTSYFGKIVIQTDSIEQKSFSIPVIIFKNSTIN